MWMWAPALACGNTFVLKPSEKDPSASLYVAELLKEAGVPDGVFNVVQGDKVAVDALLEHPDVVGGQLRRLDADRAVRLRDGHARHGKRVQALGGAKNHMIVLPDADVDMAADAAVSAGVRLGRRALHGRLGRRRRRRGRRSARRRRSRSAPRRSRSATASSPDSEMGPLITGEHRDKVASYLDSGSEQGAKVVVDGRESAPDGDGFFLGVSLLDEVTPEMDCYRDEIFGPVLSVVRVDTYDEAVRLVNENPYGNGTAIFTRDGGVARQFQFDAQAGMVGINVPIPVPVAWFSFGGWKASLFGDTHAYGPESVNFYTRGKVVTSRWPDPATSKVNLGFPQTR